MIDGTISENINNLNPQDIETFTVLKDASAVAIYGSRAANGVVVINTNVVKWMRNRQFRSRRNRASNKKAI